MTWLCLLFLTDWPMFRGNSQLTGYVSEKLVESPSLLWSHQVEEGTESTAAIFEGTVFVGDLMGKLTALDLETGKLKWSFATDMEIKSSPSIVDELVIIGNENGKLVALNRVSGEPVWTFEAEGAIVSSVNRVDERLFFGSYDNSLYCLGLDGKLLWRVETDGYVHGTPAIAGQKVIFGGCDGLVHAVHVETGKDVFSLKAGGYVAASACIVGDQAVIAHFESKIIGVDLKKQTVSWTFADEVRQHPFYASPASNGEVVVVAGRDKTARALELDSGQLIWTYECRSKMDSSPVIAGDRVYVATTRGELMALDMGNGDLKWSYTSGDGFVASPAIADQRLVIGTHSGTILCFGEKK